MNTYKVVLRQREKYTEQWVPVSFPQVQLLRHGADNQPLLGLGLSIGRAIPPLPLSAYFASIVTARLLVSAMLQLHVSAQLTCQYY